MSHPSYPSSKSAGARTLVQTPSENAAQAYRARRMVAAPRPHLYLSVFTAWLLALIWFHPRLSGLLWAEEGFFSWCALVFFVFFTELAWLYGLYNVGVVVFAALYQRRKKPPTGSAPPRFAGTEVAVLYTTRNDFVEASARSCVTLDYTHYHVYILDDSTDPAYRRRVDAFAAEWRDRVTVVRRGTSKGFKAGNLNHALATTAHEPLFAIADADEILPKNFLRVLVPKLLANPNCGFIQANHRANPDAPSELARIMGTGIDIHWRWYQPLRNYYGFVMFLGHGALLRRHAWEEVGGFPEIVSEDLAYALAIREKGYYGVFEETVTCYEDFPETVRAFRVRHVKWTRGTSEFLRLHFWPVVRSPLISWTEKLDVLFPTLNLPLSLAYFCFMVVAGLFLPWILGEPHPLTLVLGSREIVVPLRGLPPEFASIFTADFYAITVLTIFAPVLCFIVELIRRPWQLFKFLTDSTVLYAALCPLSAVSVLSFLVTGEARFLVTGDTASPSGNAETRPLGRVLGDTHPDRLAVRGFEFLSGAVFLIGSALSFQVSFFGLAIAYLLLPSMHRRGWDRGPARVLKWLPFALIVAGILLGGLSVMGLEPALFGYGFHF